MKESICHLGDCLEWLRTLPDASVDLLLTDPPYDVALDKKQKCLQRLKKLGEKQVEAAKHYVEWRCDYDALAREFWRVLKNNTHGYVFCADKQLPKWVAALSAAGMKNWQLLIWSKNRPTLDPTFGGYHPYSHEFILFFHKGFRKLRHRRRLLPFRSVLDCPTERDRHSHLSPRPGLLLDHLIRLSSEPGDVVLDPFAGSGQHLVAALRCNRTPLGCEISPVYHSRILKRLSFVEAQARLGDIESYGA